MDRNHFDRRCASQVVLIGGLMVLSMCAVGQAQLTVGDSNVGYIDSAIPATQFRLRFDAGYASEFADRVEFVYAKYGTPGAPLVERRINSHQELSAYLEFAPADPFSLFVEVPVRWINPEVNDNEGGLYDMNAGAKLAIHETDVSLLSAQFRTYMATGDTDAGLSTGHASLEPAVLYMLSLSERLTLEAELRDWIPIDASQTGPGGTGGGGGGGGGGAGQGGNREFGGNVLRYGVGLGYLLCDYPVYSITPVSEVVGWHVWDGLKSTSDGQRISAEGDAIVNLKLGVRFGKKRCGPDCQQADTLFIGYGTALTDQVWYQDILRAEMRWAF